MIQKITMLIWFSSSLFSFFLLFEHFFYYRSSSVDKASGKGKKSKFGKNDQDKNDEVIKVLRRSNAYAAEKPSSPQRPSNSKPARSDVGLIPQPFGTPRSPPVSSNTLESAQVS